MSKLSDMEGPLDDLIGLTEAMDLAAAGAFDLDPEEKSALRTLARVANKKAKEALAIWEASLKPRAVSA